MADRVEWSIRATPIETVTKAVTYSNISNTGDYPNTTDNTYDVIATEVGASIGGSGTAVVTNYQNDNNNQGIGGQDAGPGVRYYTNCVDDSATAFIGGHTLTFFIIRNTGRLYSSRTELGGIVPATGDHVLVTLVNTTTNVLSFLAPGEVFMMSIGGTALSNHPLDVTKIKVQSFQSDGTAAGSDDHIAVEFLGTD